MEYRDVVLARRSIRQFLAEPVPLEDVKDMIALATQAANSGNKQYWKFIVIQSDEIKNAMVNAVRDKSRQLLEEAEKKSGVKSSYTPHEFYAQAPVVVAVVSTGVYRTKSDALMISAGHNEREVDDLRCRGDMQTIGAVVQLLLLAAWEKGYGSCWMTGMLFARHELERLLKVQNGHHLAALVPIGKATFIPQKAERKSLSEVLQIL